MSSPEFADLRAISGTAAAKRCSLLASPAKRQLLWFIQGLSLTEGGLKQLVRELLKMFPDRIVAIERFKLDGDFDLDESDAPFKEISHDEYIRFALGKWWGQREKRGQWGRDGWAQSLEEFLVDLCINPRIRIRLKQGELETSECEVNLAKDEFPELGDNDFRDAKLPYFRDVVGALVDYKRRHEERVRSEFCHTAISRQIWEQLDYALKTKRMIVLQGREGRGKTEAVLAWCNCHLGVARFVNLKGRSTMTAHFREFARAFGLGHTRSHTISHMQANVEEVLQASHLMPVIDEAHFSFSQGPRMRTRPEMLDWIDTALCNPPLPVALVTTPQFMDCVERAVHQVGWNYLQFKRRCKRYLSLPANNTSEDIEAVARHLLPQAATATIKEVLGYTVLSKRDLSAVGDVVREARLLADQAGAAKVTFEHVRRAIHEVLLVSDLPWAEMEKRLRDKQRGRKAWRHPIAVAPETAPEAAQEPAETRGRDILPRLTPSAPRGNRMRLQDPVSALVGEPDEAILTPG